MLVSAISMCENKSLSNNDRPFRYSKHIDSIADTSFNSLTPYLAKKATSDDKTSEMYNNINEWKNYCHSVILGKNLDVIA